jgi:hypothetical protein
MLQLVHLGVDFAIHFLIAVADAYRHNAAEKIEVLIAVDIPNVLILGARYNERLFVVVEDRWEKVVAVRKQDLFFGHCMILPNAEASSRTPIK